MNLVQTLQAAGEDFEWYPTTGRMIASIASALHETRVESILDIGAGDGRVLRQLAESLKQPTLYAIEKSPILLQAQPENVTPVGTEFFEQDLMGLPMDVVVCNPPYSDYEAWAARIISTAHAHFVFLVLPTRWKESPAITEALAKRDATATVIHSDDFLNAERRARAVVDVIQITFSESHWGRQQDPFDAWFDQNIDTFDRTEAEPECEAGHDLARLHRLDSIASLVTAYEEDYARMQENYQALFKLDGKLFKELGVNKQAVRDGLKKRIAGLKNVYWTALFEHLDVITSRLTTKTKDRFRRRITAHTSVAFTSTNAYAIALWAIKFANQYFDEQLVTLFRDLSTHDGVSNYVSNQRTWQKDGWRYMADQFSHYALDYRVVKNGHAAIHQEKNGWSYRHEHPGGLYKSCHELIDDMVAVFGNLGFLVQDEPSRTRTWQANEWQNFAMPDGRVVFQVKAFLNGNMHLRFLPAAIKALNIEAGRLLGWLRSASESAAELGVSVEDSQEFFGSNQRLGASSLKLLSA